MPPWGKAFERNLFIISDAGVAAQVGVLEALTRVVLEMFRGRSRLQCACALRCVADGRGSSLDGQNIRRIPDARH